MGREEITKKSIALLATTLKIPADQVNHDAKLTDLVTDSIQLFEVVLAFEKAFKLQAKYDDLIQIQTVGDLIDYLEKQVPQRAGQ